LKLHGVIFAERRRKKLLFKLISVALCGPLNHITYKYCDGKQVS